MTPEHFEQAIGGGGVVQGVAQQVAVPSATTGNKQQENPEKTRVASIAPVFPLPLEYPRQDSNL